MRGPLRWTGIARLGLVIGLVACSGGDGDPTEPDPKGSVRATVTGDGAALAGVTVRLFANGGAAALTSGTSAANGQVTFGDLDPGAYDIDVVLPTGFELAAGQTARRDVGVEANQVATVTFALAEIVVAPTEGQIRVRVVEGSAGVPDVDVNLYAAGGSVVLETRRTGLDGRALYGSLDPGSFEVEIVLPDDYAMAGNDQARKTVAVEAGVIRDVEFGVDGPEVVAILASGTAFSPAAVTVDVGATVRWQRVDGIHTVTPVGHNEWAEADLNSANNTFVHTFDEAGEFDYECVLHAGMTGTVTVE